MADTKTTMSVEGKAADSADAKMVALEAQFPILQYFRYEHLPNAGLRDRSKPFADLARDFAARGAKNQAELAAGLRKLLEAKDCMVRAAL